MGSEGITVAVAVRGERVSVDRVELARRGQGRAGNAVRHRDAALQGPSIATAYPLQSGATWNQWINNYNELTDREGAQPLRARGPGRARDPPAGTFDAIRMQVTMRLDDEEFALADRLLLHGLVRTDVKATVARCGAPTTSRRAAGSRSAGCRRRTRRSSWCRSRPALSWPMQKASAEFRACRDRRSLLHRFEFRRAPRGGPFGARSKGTEQRASCVARACGPL